MGPRLPGWFDGPSSGNELPKMVTSIRFVPREQPLQSIIANESYRNSGVPSPSEPLQRQGLQPEDLASKRISGRTQRQPLAGVPGSQGARVQRARKLSGCRERQPWWSRWYLYGPAANVDLAIFSKWPTDQLRWWIVAAIHGSIDRPLAMLSLPVIHHYVFVATSNALSLGTGTERA